MSSNICTTDTDEIEVSFSFSCSGARSVCLAILFYDWSTQLPPARYLPWSGRGLRGPPLVKTLVRLTEIQPGFWRCEVLLPPGWCEYVFLVDGEWMLDPEAPEKCPDGDGGFNSARRVEPTARTETFRLSPAHVSVRRQRDIVRRSAA